MLDESKRMSYGKFLSKRLNQNFIERQAAALEQSRKKPTSLKDRNIARDILRSSKEQHRDLEESTVYAKLFFFSIESF